MSLFEKLDFFCIQHPSIVFILLLAVIGIASIVYLLKIIEDKNFKWISFRVFFIADKF